MFRRFTTSTTCVWVVVLFILPLPMLAALRLGLPSSYTNMSTGIGLGVIAYTWMLAAIYLAGRPRWVDRTVGLPHMYMVHGVLSLLAIAFAFVHHMLLPSEGVTKLLGTAGLYLFMALAVYSMVFLAGWLSQRFSVVRTIKTALEKVFRHEASVWIHRLNVVAVVLIFLHVQSIDFIRADVPFIILFDAVSALTLAWYLYGKIHQRMRYLDAKVVSLRQVGQGISELTVTLDPGQQAVWRPGDFVFMKFPGIRGMKEYHPFSPIDSPTDPRRDDGSVVFDIRADGDFTGLIARLQPGDRARMLPPYGRYQHVIDEHEAQAPIVLLAGGIGITPLLSVLAAHATSGREITLLYSARNEDQLLYADELRRLGEEYPNVRVDLRAGRRFPDADVERTIRKGAVYLIAGPYAMQRAWRRLMLRRGVHADQIYYEPFSM